MPGVMLLHLKFGKCMNHLVKCCGVIFLLTSLSCGTSSAVSQHPTVPNAQPSQPSNKPEEYPEQINNVFVEQDSLSYGGYDVVKLKKKVRVAQTPGLTEVSYAALKRNGKVVAKFDGIYFGLGNATDFGLFSFLGGEAKQLAVSQTIPRGGRHWVVDLSSGARVIFDSGEYGVGREEFSVIDIDKDAIYEISMPITEFYMFESMYMAETPLPEIVFKYDLKARKYFPANPAFQAYALMGIDDAIRRVNPNDASRYLSTRLDIVLRYIYAGKEAEAWSFFDEEYRLPDKEVMRAKIKAVLKKEAVYKYLYGKRATS
jgi:hypothetical protein